MIADLLYSGFFTGLRPLVLGHNNMRSMFGTVKSPISVIDKLSFSLLYSSNFIGGKVELWGVPK